MIVTPQGISGESELFVAEPIADAKAPMAVPGDSVSWTIVSNEVKLGVVPPTELGRRAGGGANATNAAVPSALASVEAVGAWVWILNYPRDRRIQNRFSAAITAAAIHRNVPRMGLTCSPTPNPR